MTVSANFLHPALFFFASALVLPFLAKVVSQQVWRWIVPIPGLLAVAAVLLMQHGEYGTLSYLGVELSLGRVDQLSYIFAHVFAIQSVIGLIFAFHVKRVWDHMAAMFYVGGGFGCVFAADYLSLFIFWEVMSVASTLLILLNMENHRARGAGFRYFLFHTLGGLLLLGGMLLRYSELGTFAFTTLAHGHGEFYDYLILAGFAVNAAVVPLHAWLPDAYPESSVHGAVFMSAFTTKTAVYVLARAFPGFEVLAIAGTIMAVYGVCYASIENNARRILAYHIVSQVGYMVAGIGIGTAMTINGACAHAYAHILYKGLLFMGTGCLLYSAGTAKLSELGGLVRRMPFVFLLYMVAAVSISGMPFFNGFVSKTMTIAGAAEAHRTWIALFLEVAAVGTFLSVGLKLPYFAFYAKPESKLALKPIPKNMYFAMSIGAALCFITGIFPNLLYDLLPFQHGVEPYAQVHHLHETEYHPYTAWHLLQSFMLLGFTGLGFYFMRVIITPHAQRNRDFEWLYFALGKLFYAVVSRPLAAIDAVWSEVYRVVGIGMLRAFGKGTSVFDRAGIDGVVDGTAYAVGAVGKGAAKLETGRLQTYAGLAAVLAMLVFATVHYLGQ